MAEPRAWTDANRRARIHGVTFPEIDKSLDRLPFPDAGLQTGGLQTPTGLGTAA